MGRGKKFGISFAVAVAVMGALFFVHYVPRFETRVQHTTLGVVDWALISFFSLLGALAIWGMVGIGLSQLKKRVQVLALKEVIISRRSWHYRLNRRLNFGKEPDGFQGECEYWAQLSHGLQSTPLIYVLFTVLRILIGAIGWFFGAKPDLASIIRISSTDLIFKKGSQRGGPIVLFFMAIGGIYSIETFFGVGPKVAHAFVYIPWTHLGIWTGIILGIIFAFFLVVLVMIAIWPYTAQPFFSWVIASLAGVCRQARYVD